MRGKGDAIFAFLCCFARRARRAARAKARGASAIMHSRRRLTRPLFFSIFLFFIQLLPPLLPVWHLSLTTHYHAFSIENYAMLLLVFTPLFSLFIMPLFSPEYMLLDRIDEPFLFSERHIISNRNRHRHISFRSVEGVTHAFLSSPNRDIDRIAAVFFTASFSLFHLLHQQKRRRV